VYCLNCPSACVQACREPRNEAKLEVVKLVYFNDEDHRPEYLNGRIMICILP
jgi:hypothetical protein